MPAAVMLLVVRRRLLRVAMFAMLLPLLVFQSTSINFFSHEWYRGTSRGMEVSLIYLAAVVIVCAITLLRGFRPFLPNAGAKLYALYFALSLPSLLTAENTLFSFFEIWKMAMIYFVYLAVYYYLEYTKGDFKPILLAFAAIVVCVFASVVKQHFSGVYQVYAQFPHQNSLAMFMMPVGVLFFSAFLNGKAKGYGRLVYFGLFLMASGALLRTYSRGAIACYPIACVITAGLSVAFEFKPQKVRALGAICAVGGLVVLMFIPRVIERFESAPESSGQTRLNFAIAAKNMIMDEPFFGVGINNWGIKINPPYKYSEHRDPSKGFTDDYKDGIVETIYLLVCAECGIPCFIALLAFFFHHLKTAFSAMRKLRYTPYFFIPAALVGGFAGIYLQSVLEWVLKQQVNFTELMVLFAIVSFADKYAQALRVRAKAASKSGGILA